jgi:UDP-glucose 4-epimerase
MPNCSADRRLLKVLVSGGAGFIGTHLVRELLRQGMKVTILDNFSSGQESNLTDAKARRALVVRGDIRDRSCVDGALDGADIVVHLAAIKSVPFSMEHPEVTHQTNVLGTRNLFDASRRLGVQRFILVSTCAVYGEAKYLPIDEDHPLRPMSPYAKSKIEAERYCLDSKSGGSPDTMILRLFNVYGPGQPADGYSGVITRFIESMKVGKPVTIYGTGKQCRDFVNVEDVSAAIIRSIKAHRRLCGVYNIGTGRATTISELERIIATLLSDSPKVNHMRARPGDIKRSQADIGKARKYLGFSPAISLEDGLGQLVLT